MHCIVGMNITITVQYVGIGMENKTKTGKNGGLLKYSLYIV
jgi:hypothetical protein